MTIKTSIKLLLDDHAVDIIKELPNKFDSHAFIQKLIKKDEERYIIELYGCLKPKGTFQYFHSQIGRYLSEERFKLEIESQGKILSKNIKNYISDNEGWIKNKSLSHE